MSYRVVISATARAQIRAQSRYIAIEEQAPETAARWLRRVIEVAESLAEMPHRCSRAPEDRYRSYDIRWLSVGRFALLFTIVDEKTVLILSARSELRLPRPQDLPGEVADIG